MSSAAVDPALALLDENSWPTGEARIFPRVIDLIDAPLLQQGPVMLRVRCPQSLREAELYFYDNNLIHAMSEGCTAMTALVHVLFWSPVEIVYSGTTPGSTELLMPPARLKTFYQNLAKAGGGSEERAVQAFQDAKRRMQEAKAQLNARGTLTVLNSMMEGAVIDLTPLFTGKVRSLRFGRAKTCDVHVDNLCVSGEHCELSPAGDARNPLLYVVDLKSTNGTRINGEFILKEGTLRDGDLLEVGSVQFKVYLPPKHATGPTPPSPATAASAALPHAQTQHGDSPAPAAAAAPSSLPTPPGAGANSPSALTAPVPAPTPDATTSALAGAGAPPTAPGASTGNGSSSLRGTTMALPQINRKPKSAAISLPSEPVVAQPQVSPNGTQEESATLSPLLDTDFFYKDDRGVIRSVFSVAEVAEYLSSHQVPYVGLEIKTQGNSNLKHTVTGVQYKDFCAKVAKLQAAIRRLTH